MFRISVRIVPLCKFQQISKTYVLWENKNKTSPFLHISLFRLQQQIHFNGICFQNVLAA